MAHLKNCSGKTGREKRLWCLSKVSVTEAEAENWREDGNKIYVYAWIRVWVLSIHGQALYPYATTAANC